MSLKRSMISALRAKYEAEIEMVYYYKYLFK